MNWCSRRALAIVGAALSLMVSSSTGSAASLGYHTAIRAEANSTLDTSVAMEEGASLAMQAGDHDASQTIGSRQVIDSEELRSLAARGAEDVTALQAGVVIDRQTGNLYVRGGEANELVYYVDGVPLQDAFSGMSSARVGAAAIASVAVATGGLDAGYGWGMAGATDIATVEGGRRLHGSAEAITDNFHGDRSDYNLYGLSLNGPLIPNSDRLTFSAAGERGWSGGTSLGSWTWNGKLRWKPAGNITASIGGQRYQEDFRTYLRSYYFDSRHAPRTVNKSGAFWGQLTHDLNSKTSYTLRGYWVGSDHKTGDGEYFDNLWGYGRPSGNPRSDATGLFWSWDDMNLNPDSLAKGVHYTMHTREVDTTINVTLPDGSVIQKTFVLTGDEGAVWHDYIHQRGSYVGGRADVASQIGEKNALEFGAEFQRHSLRSYHNLFPTRIYLGTDAGLHDVNSFGYDALGSTETDNGWDAAKHPVSIAGYVQDRFEVADLSFNAGVRLDYLDYNGYVLRNAANPLDPDGNIFRIYHDTTLTPAQRDSLAFEAGRLTMSDLAKSKALVRISPRLGASYRIPAGPLLHFSFGRYFQRPDFDRVYTSFSFLEYKIKTGGYSAAAGSSNLKPASMTTWEFGVQHKVTEYLTVDLTGFIRNAGDLVQTVLQPTAPNSYTTYRNGPTFTSKGLEFQLSMRRRWGFSGQLKYTLQTTTSSYMPGPSENVSWTGGEAPRVTSPAWNDQRQKLTAIVDARLGEKRGLSIGSIHPFERSGINFVFNAASGFPYTPTQAYNSLYIYPFSVAPLGGVNSRRIPATYRLDLKADKMFPVGGVNVSVYFWALNVLDRKNVLEVYSATGSPDDNGWLATADGQAYVQSFPQVTDASLLTGAQKYQLRQNDPTFFDTPRQIRVGMIVEW